MKFHSTLGWLNEGEFIMFNEFYSTDGSKRKVPIVDGIGRIISFSHPPSTMADLTYTDDVHRTIKIKIMAIGTMRATASSSSVYRSWFVKSAQITSILDEIECKIRYSDIL